MLNPADGDKPAAPAAAIPHKSPLSFVGAFIREPFTVGSLWPSSTALSQLVVDSCEFKPDDTVVELGPGTGPFTGLLLQRINQSGRLVAMEISATNAEVLRKKFPRCQTIQDSAENLPQHLNGAKASCIVSGLAWGNMMPALQDRIFEAILRSLGPQGQFVAFAYVHAYWFPTSRRFRQRIAKDFAQIETTKIIWGNLPPAFVFRCWRA